MTEDIFTLLRNVRFYMEKVIENPLRWETFTLKKQFLFFLLLVVLNVRFTVGLNRVHNYQGQEG